MKKKGINSLLLTIVGLIWAAVIWRYLLSKPAQEASAPTPQTIAVSYRSPDMPDTFTLDLSYHDPFLKRPFTPNQALQAPRQTGPRPVQTIGKMVDVRPKVPLPDIHFLGWIDKADTISGRAMISLDDKVYSMQVGEAQEGITILEITPHFLTISFADSTYQILRSP